jgi:hypothetical protein
MAAAAAAHIVRVFELLGLEPPAGLELAQIGDIWRWGFSRWDVARVPRRLQNRVFF